MSEIHIDSYDQQRPDLLIPLFEAQFREHDIHTSSATLLSVLRLLEQHPRHGFLLNAVCEGAPVGIAYATSILSLEHGGWSGWLEEFYVLPAFRGQGVGLRLLTAVIAAAAERDWKALDLEVDSGHQRVVALYVRNGFEPVHRTRYVRHL